MALFNRRDEHIETLRAELAKERARYDALLETYHTLRLQGFTPRQSATTMPAPKVAMRDMDEVARDGAISEAVDRMAADFEKRGHEPAVARAEAERIVKSLSQIREEE